MNPDDAKTELLISVIVTCYNDGEFIDEAIASVKSSTYKNIELLIIDDFSTDENTRNRLNALETSNHTVIRKKSNTGAADSRNTGIRNSKGKYILTLDADDRIHATYIEKAIHHLINGFSVVYCNVKSFGTINAVRIAPVFSVPLLLTGNFVASCSAFTKEMWNLSDGYDSNMACYEDWEFWINIASHGGRFYNMNEILFEYRRKSISLNSKCNQPEVRKNMVEYIAKKHYKLYQQHVTEIVPALHNVIATLENDLRLINTMAENGNIADLLERVKNAETTLEQKTSFYENSFFWKLKKIADRITGR